MLDRTVAFGLDFHFPARDVVIGRSLAEYGEFARPLSDFLIDSATGKPGALIDVGANIGSVCLPFARARPAWRVIAVEPHRGLSKVLAANAVANGLHNVEVVQAACGGKTRIIPFANPPLGIKGNFGTMAVGRVGRAELVPTLMARLDELAPANTRLVKVDAEGMDAEVLRGAPRLLNELRPVWVVEAAVNHPQTSRQVIEILLEAGYACHWFFVTFASHVNLKGRPPEHPAMGDANVIALPPGVTTTWSLPEIRSADDARPAEAEAYGYLARYGLTAATCGA